MITTSDKYKANLYNAVDEEIVGKLSLIDGSERELTAELIEQSSFTFTESACSGGFGVGALIADEIALTLYISNSESVSLAGAEVSLAKVWTFDDGSTQTIDLGTFTIDTGSIKRKRNRLSFHAYNGAISFDKFIPLSTTVSGTPYSLLSWACEQSGISLLTSKTTISALPNGSTNFTWAKQEKSYTYRDFVCCVLSLLGAFGRMNRSTGALEVVSFSTTDSFVIDEDNAIDRSVSDSAVFVSGIRHGDTVVGGELGFVLDFSDNPLLSGKNVNTVLSKVLSKVSEHSLYNADVTWFGDLSVQAGDRFTYKQDNLFGGERSIIVMESVWKSHGKCYIRSFGDNEASIYNPISRQALATMQALSFLKANYIDAETIRATYLMATDAELKYATITELDAAKATITQLSSEKLNANELSAEVAKLGYATVGELEAEKGRIDMLNATKLEATSAEIVKLESGIADINTLIFGSASGNVIQTEFANAVVAQLGNAQIKSAMIESVSAGQITAGDIITNNVRVVSEDGSLLISDETMQISDGSTTRVQLGKDALGDYSLYVWDAQGNLMFDALGVHEAGIKSGIIRDDMVSDTANISAGKLNIDSLFTAINSDGSHTLNASKVLIDANAQTLDVAFGALNTKVTDVDSRVSTMGTELGILQGQITSKIWEQDITTAINGVKGDITALSTSYSVLSQDVSSFKTEVAETYTTNEEFDDAFDVHGTATVFGDANWIVVISASLLAGVLSMLTSVAGLPEMED